MKSIYLRPLIYLVPIILIITFGVNYIFNSENSDGNSKVTNFDINQLSVDSFEDLNGIRREVSASSKVIIIHFWASWCGPCVEEFPQLIEMVKTMNGDVVVYAISGDSVKSEIDVFLKSFPAAKELKHMHIVWDSEKKYIQGWQVNKLPESYIYDSNKKLAKRISGAVDWSSADAKEFISSIIKK